MKHETPGNGGMTDITEIPVTAADGSSTDLSVHKGKVLLVVNVASKCCFTPQYEGLEALQRKYEGRGFTVLGFPCNQFAAQEPGDADEIANFCKLTYDVDLSADGKDRRQRAGRGADLSPSQAGSAWPAQFGGRQVASPSCWSTPRARWSGVMRHAPSRKI
jgi:hypothetical protein